MELNAGLVTFLFGCAGGLGINVFSAYEAWRQPKEVRPSFGLLYFGQAFILSILGGVWALANHLTKPISPISAFYLGLSIPALIKAGADRKARKARPGKRID